ncbi:MAG: replication-associated recombination protein A [Candidatus Omnitrophica bacterium]|nr:replication-associated recombination protein A [Candidatus Omnitrophota bacterium]
MVSSESHIPLAVRLRPLTLDEFVGQRHILGEGKLLYRAISSPQQSSFLFYGPAGCGKTTLGFILARLRNAYFHYLNAAFSSVAEVKKILKDARTRLEKENQRTILFIDEIHRFNKLQQEILVPDTEEGTIILIGATIYNPRYYLIPSINSRSVQAEFKPLEIDDIKILLARALTDKERGLGQTPVTITNKALHYIALHSSGDARRALNSLEMAVRTTPAGEDGKIILDLEVAKDSIQKNLVYDKKDAYHYDTISAFIKSIRGSDPDSALYWLAKMIVSGEDPRFIARRLVILASEDIGNAEPFALVLATNSFKAVEFVGMPEAQLILAQATVYLATCPKSNTSYKALNEALADVREEETKEVPDHIKTHSDEYKYPHAFGGYIEQEYGAKKRYYQPLNIGYEAKIKGFLDQIKKKG